MANNRIFLALPSGKKVMLASYMPSYGWVSADCLEQKLNKFLSGVTIPDINEGNFQVKLEFEHGKRSEASHGP